MAITLPLTYPAWGRPVVSGRPRWSSRTEARLKDVERLGAMAYAAVFPLVQVGLIAESTHMGWDGGADGAWALLATAALLPFHLRHVAYAARGSRAPGGAWTLAAMSAVVLAATVPLSDLWLPTFHVIAVSALLVLRPRAALPVVVAVVAAQVPLALLLDSQVPAAPSYYVATVMWRSAAVFVPIWLVGAVRGLTAARQALADEALVRERLRLDAELRATLGTSLQAIEAGGERAGTSLDERQLADLVRSARQTLAQARRLVNGYQRGSLATELETASILLTAAGIATRVVLPPAGIPDSADDAARSALRTDVARVLRDADAAVCVITVTERSGRVTVDVGAS